MAISPVLQHIHVVRSAAVRAAQVISRPITDIFVTDRTIRVVAHDESVEFGIRPPSTICDSDRRPMIGGSMPTLVGDGRVKIAGGRRRRRIPGAAMSQKRMIMLGGVIDYAAHGGDGPIATIHVRGRFFRVTCGTQTRWLVCTRARHVPYPPYSGYDETSFMPVIPLVRGRAPLGRLE